MASVKSLMTWGWFEATGIIPDAPSNLLASPISNTVIHLSWDFDASSIGFDVYRALSISGTFEKINSDPILALDFYDGQDSTPLSADTTYFYKVQALGVEPEYNSPFSVIVSATTYTSGGGQQFYYPETIRNVTVALLDMFNDFYIRRYDKTPNRDGLLVKTVHVPITFGQAEKRHLDETRNNQDGYQAPPLPRMALILNGIEYDPNRASGVNELRHFYNEALQIADLDSFFDQLNPAPYNFNFTLSIQTLSMTDFSQIVENVLPFFNPMRYLRVKEFAFLNIERDLPVILGGITPTFTESLEVGDRRRVDGDLEIKIQGWMYRPISSVKIIKTIKTNYLISDFIGNEVLEETREIIS